MPMIPPPTYPCPNAYIEVVGVGTKNSGVPANMKGIVATSPIDLARQTGNKVKLSDCSIFKICSNTIFACFCWIASHVPFLYAFLPKENYGETAQACGRLPASTTGPVPAGPAAPNVAAAADIPQTNETILANARTIWCKGSEGGQFVLSVDGGAHEVRVGNLSALRDCRLEELSISDFPGTTLDLSSVFAKKIDISNCPTLEHVDAKGCTAKEIAVNFCDSLRTVVGGAVLRSFQADTCANLSELDFSQSIVLNAIDLPNSGIPDVKLPPQTPYYVSRRIHEDHRAMW
jgi:hypothetical protein